MVQKIAREVTSRGSFTVIYYRDAKETRVQRFPTTDQEHADIRKLYRHDRYDPHVWNDFSLFRVGDDERDRTTPTS